MKIDIKNLGPIKQTVIDTGNLTILCGENNAGKTYATYALYGFLKTWRKLISVSAPSDVLSVLALNGTVEINLLPYVEQVGDKMREASSRYVDELGKIMATAQDRFVDTKIDFSFNKQEGLESLEQESIYYLSDKSTLSLKKESGSRKIIVSYIGAESISQHPGNLIESAICREIIELVYAPMLPRVFIVSAERTGAAIFGRELDFARNRMLDALSMMKQGEQRIPQVVYDYVLPIKDNVDFARRVGAVSNKSSYLTSMDSGKIALDYFDKIIGGAYKVQAKSPNQIVFTPDGSGVKLNVGESSSSVRSMMDLGFYMKQEARLGDLLIIDEPELNLHPTNQRKVARLLAMLVNSGVNVFVTTHSDYMVREFNTLIMLAHVPAEKRARLSLSKVYGSDEIMPASKVKVYCAVDRLLKLEGYSRKIRAKVFSEMTVSEKQGICVESFDTCIREMNAIQSEIQNFEEL